MGQSRHIGRGRSRFDHFAEHVSDVVSGAAFFAISAALVVIWLPTIAVFRSVDTWQLVINTATSILAFLLVALLQNSERRSDRAASRKLDVIAGALADVIAAQLDGGDREALESRIAELRDTIEVEEQI
jgi:low affinity Fe/Cu permease